MSTFFTIFGASWDLAKLKIYPALFTLALRNKLPKDFFIIGYARSGFSQEAFFALFSASVRSQSERWDDHEESVLTSLEERVHYIAAPYDSLDGFTKYRKVLKTLSSKGEGSTQVLYLAVPPSIVSPILSYFSSTFPDREARDIRVILEKPFWHDESSARILLAELGNYYADEELYFLDHYMGKKSMRSLLSLRAKNRIIDTIIDPKEIAQIEISALENFDIRDRVGYFDSVGIIRDMVQSHLFQMLALITLDLPITLDPGSIARARQHLLEKLIFSPARDRVILGQYASYQGASEVTRDSITETYVALSLSIDDPRWRNIPIYMRSGKSLEQKETYIVITFRPSDHANMDDEPNRLIISLYPSEEISLRFLDESGDRRETHEIITHDSIAGDPLEYLGSHELLFLDAIEHERRFFLTPAEILASWKCIDTVFAHIRGQVIIPEIYPNQSIWPQGQFDVLWTWYDLDKK